MRILGAILAGGRSHRFGSNKAKALFKGKALIDHVADVLRPQVDALVVAGWNWPGQMMVEDRPKPDLGPLGGLAGALDHAWRQDFDAVLSCGCDILWLPDDLIRHLGDAPAIVADLPVIGLWPVGLCQSLHAWLASGRKPSVYGFADHIGARRVHLPKPLININHPDDLIGLG
ncbi:MAG: molybdenum cofactor guanylyltransferase [Sphingorhabdus sp.]